jgi:hypothetical protein
MNGRPLETCGVFTEELGKLGESGVQAASNRRAAGCEAQVRLVWGVDSDSLLAQRASGFDRAA